MSSKKRKNPPLKKNIIGQVFYKPRKSFILEKKTALKYKLGEKEIFKTFPGDIVSCSISKSGWATIQKIVKSNVNEVIAEIKYLNKKWVASPLNFGKEFFIPITKAPPSNISKGNLVKVKIKRSPGFKSRASGEIISIISESNVIKKATEISIIKNEVHEKWPRNLSKELDGMLTNSVNEINSNRRVNLRDKGFVTIDGKNAKDFDDAVYAEENHNGNINLYVAIADVAHFIKPNSIIDQEAKTRGTSIYFPEKVVPMLPEIISNDICSLKPKEDRLVLVSSIEIDETGKVLEAKFFEGIIRSKARLIYENLEKETEQTKNNKEYFKSLQTLRKANKLLRKEKLNRGALELNIPQYIPVVKGNKIIKFLNPPRGESHLLIEECMLLANISAAELLRKSKFPSIYRVHPKPDLDRINKLEAFVRSKKINIKLSTPVKVKELSKLVQDIKERKDALIFHMQILQTLSLAKYEISVIEHFALGYPAYTHFTSPIRRYPDLLVHRAIKGLLSKSKNKEITISTIKNSKIDKKIYPYNEEELQTLAVLSSSQERLAETASRDVMKTLKCECALANLNKEFKGTIQAVTNFGLFILINDLNIEGLCHIKYLPKKEYYTFNENSQTLSSNKSGHFYSLGDELIIKIKRVDVFAQMIDLEIL